MVLFARASSRKGLRSPLPLGEGQGEGFVAAVAEPSPAPWARPLPEGEVTAESEPAGRYHLPERSPCARKEISKKKFFENVNTSLSFRPERSEAEESRSAETASARTKAVAVSALRDPSAALGMTGGPRRSSRKASADKKKSRKWEGRKSKEALKCEQRHFEPRESAQEGSDTSASATTSDGLVQMKRSPQSTSAAAVSLVQPGASVKSSM